MHDTFHYERYRDQEVLEIGVGLGTDHLQFGRAGARLTGVDLTPACIDLTRRRFELEGLTSDLRVMDAERLEFPDNSFDAVYSFGVLHHIASTEAAFVEVRRVLRSGGVFIGGLYSRESIFFARVAAEWLLRGGPRKESWESRKARIEYSTSDAQPHVRLLGSRELRRALREAGFAEVSLTRRHSALGSLTYDLPPVVERTLGRVGGWYLVHEAR